MPRSHVAPSTPVIPGWRTSRYSQGGQAQACVQAGAAVLNLNDGSVHLSEPGTPTAQIVLRPPRGPIRTTTDTAVESDIGRVAAATAYRVAQERVARAGAFFERLGEEEHAELLLQATELMGPRHRAFPMSVDANDRAARRDEVLEKVRLAVAHQIFLDQGDTTNARDLAEELRRVYGTARTNEFITSGGMPIELFGKTFFGKKGSASATQYAPPSSISLNDINPHLVGVSIIDADSFSRDVDSLRTYTPDKLLKYRVRTPENATDTVLRDTPWTDHRQYFLLSHGNARLLLDADENMMFGPQVATFIRHRQDWRTLRADNPNAGIVLLGCEVGQVDGGPAQQVADHLGVVVFASRYSGWTLDNHLEVASTHSDWGEFRTFLPGDASTTSLRFAHRDVLSTDQRRQVSAMARAVAADGIRLAAEMRLTPVVHVTGYNAKADQNKAQARVRSVIVFFRQQLEAELERLQHGSARPLAITSFPITSDVWEGSDVPPLVRRNVREDSPGELERHVLVTVHTPSPAHKLAVAADDDLGDLMFAVSDDDLGEGSAAALAPGSAARSRVPRTSSTDEWSRRSAVPGGARGTSFGPVPASRPLPATPGTMITEPRPRFGRQLTLPPTRSGEHQRPTGERGPWSLISGPVPGVTTRPSINRNVIDVMDQVNERSAKAEADRFLAQRYPELRNLNPTRNDLNCNQAVIAVDRMLDGDTAVRIPPSDRTDFYGLDLLQTRHHGEYVPVSSYDDVIERIAERSGERGVVYVGWDDGGHLFNVVNTSDGVVFLDGQTGHLASLPDDTRRLALMRYRPPGPLPAAHEVGTPHVVTDQDGTQWASGSRSARDGEGNLIPDDHRACVEVTVRSVELVGRPSPALL